MTNIKPFSTFLSLEQFEELFKDCPGYPNNSQTCEEVFALCPISSDEKDAFGMYLRFFFDDFAPKLSAIAFEYLVYLRDNNALPLIETCNIDTNFGTLWNTFVNNDFNPTVEHWQIRDLKAYCGNIINETLSMRFRCTILDNYTHLEESLTNGNCKKIAESQCSNSGQELKYHISNWHPIPMVFDQNATHLGKWGGMVAPQPVGDDKMEGFELTFDDEVVYVADWFRVDGFSTASDYTKDVKYLNENSINHRDGRNKNVYRHAAQGFAAFHVGNSCPNVYQFGDTYVVGSQLCNEDDSAAVASVCTDYWGVTLCTRAQMIKILTPEHGEEKATSLVDDYINTGGSKPDSFKIQPGTYNFKFVDNSYRFKEFDIDASLDYTSLGLDNIYFTMELV